MKVLLITVALTILYLTTPAGSRASPSRSIAQIICGVFGPYCDQALRVARCESGLRTWASNGQYLGLFQMGSHERATYGHGPDAWTQAQAAFRYFADSHYSWGPWACKP